MTDEKNISGRPSTEQLAEFVNYGEIASSPLEAITYRVLPEGWDVVGTPRSKNEIFEMYRGSSLAERLESKHGAGNWGVMNRDEVSVDIIAHRETESDAEDTIDTKLGHIAVSSSKEAQG